MNCRDVEKLIPLYTGGELNPAEVAGVRRHIESCERCREVVAEFAESRAWLRELGVPAFDEAIFDNLRAAVREETARVQSGSSLFDLLAPVWNRRAGIAASTAALLLSGLLIYTYRPKPVEEPLTTSRPASGDNQEEIADIDIPQHNRRRKAPATHHPRRLLLPSIDNGKTEVNLPVITLNNRIGGSEFKLPSHSEIANEDMDRKEMLRIEIQTADPNIRIIWISPKNPSL